MPISTAPAGVPDRVGAGIHVGRPDIGDGAACHTLAAASRVLDVNSRYAYVLWFRDFAATSAVARLDGAVIGFVTGYRRPDEQNTLVVWQVAVEEEVRGRGVAAAMLDVVFESVPDVDHLETTITPDNTGSAALFTGFAARRAADVRRSELFGTDVLGADHQPEVLFRIGPINR